MFTKTANLLSGLISALFILLFFVTPFILLPWTSELFEMPKMLFVYLITLLITTVWLLHLPITGTFPFKRTPFDIPIIIFLISQILATVFSIHPYTSIWGWYTRLHGGLASTISYLILYYAFVTFTSQPKDNQLSSLSSPRRRGPMIRTIQHLEIKPKTLTNTITMDSRLRGNDNT